MKRALSAALVGGCSVVCLIAFIAEGGGLYLLGTILGGRFLSHMA